MSLGISTRRIGAIVAGCLIIGLVAAIVLVAGPFAGAQEHVITGTVLLAFAVGWALLAALSVLWTDQPQRWAAAPAGLMALAGGGLIVSAPNAVVLDALGWVWPPVLLALVVWMTVRSHRHLRSRVRPWFLYPVFGVLALAAVGGGYETIRESVDRGVYTMPGRLVDVGGHRLHLHCTGSGIPTVVMETGLGEASPVWGWIAPAVARDTRVCVYDRAGQGWSEPASSPQDAVAIATDLHTLLDRAHVAGPYVLVGHSVGGLYVLTFAARYPDQVAGMMLLDSPHPEGFTRMPNLLAFYDNFRRISALFPPLSRMGVGRLVYQSSFQSSFGSLPSRARDEDRAFRSTARTARSMRDEWAEAPTANKQAQSLKSLGSKPLIVITAGFVHMAGWLPLQDDLAALSTNSIHRVLPNAAHGSLLYDKGYAAVSSQAIRDVVESVRAGRPLAK